MSGNVLFSLSGWNLILYCAKCGPTEKSVDALLKHTKGSVTLNKYLPRLRCHRCNGKPEKLEAVCTWIMKYGRDPIVVDLTELAVVSVEKAVA